MRPIARFLTVLALLSICPASPAMADFKKGMSAYEAGDYATALKEWRPLAEKGNTDAQYGLGLIYDSGKGVPQNNAEAVRWYRMAAEQGDADAQSSLGFLYAKGQGVPQDLVQAHLWLYLAAAQGDKGAAKERDLLVKKMTPVQLTQAQKLARGWKPKK